MIRNLFALTLLAAGILASSATRAADKKDDKKDDTGWIQLFNGKDLTGWKTFPEGSGTGNWKVEDSCIFGSGPVSHLFSEKGDYENFYYRIEAKISDKGNSGQYFRTAFGGGFPKGYEAQINATHGDKIKTGSLYLPGVKEVLVLNTAPHKPDEWFTQEVMADGDHIVIKVNGKVTVDYKDPKNRYTKGHFALQQHNQGSEVRVRKIEIKLLPPTKK